MKPTTEVGLNGLRNQGATCYLNSVLQVLFMTKDFREAVERYTCDNRSTECIDRQLNTLFHTLNEEAANPDDITKKLGITRVYEQQDAAEYFEKILNLTSDEASQMFHGMLTHRTTCSACDTKTETDGPFWHLPLALVDSDSEYSVVKGIEEYFTALEFSGDNQMYCDKCDDKRDATIKCEIKHHPKVLTLLLKKFELDYSTMTYIKMNHTVSVPCMLQIPENQTYELYAFVEHFGDLRGGHYTATIKSQEDETQKVTWYNFSDTMVTLVDSPFQSGNFQRSKSAYLLFYRKNAQTADTCTPATTEEVDQCQDAAMSNKLGPKKINSITEEEVDEIKKSLKFMSYIYIYDISGQQKVIMDFMGEKKELIKQNVEKDKKIGMFEARVSDLEQNSRINDVIVSGLDIKPSPTARAVRADGEPTEPDLDSLEQQVINPLDSKGINVDTQDIETCHPLPQRNKKQESEDSIAYTGEKAERN